MLSRYELDPFQNNYIALLVAIFMQVSAEQAFELMEKVPVKRNRDIIPQQLIKRMHDLLENGEQKYTYDKLEQIYKFNKYKIFRAVKKYRERGNT